MFAKKASFVGAAVLALGCGGVPGEGTDGQAVKVGQSQSALTSAPSEVDQSNCQEIIGEVNIQASRARPFVPASYTLAADSTGTTQLIVRISKCDEAGAVKGMGVTEEQIGIPVVSPDGTGFINAYSLVFASPSAELRRFVASGGLLTVPDRVTLTSTTNPDGSLSAVASAGTLFGTLQLNAAGAPRFDAGPLVANWWQQVRGGQLKLINTVPDAQLGFCGGTLDFVPGGLASRLFNVSGHSVPLDVCFNNSFASGVYTEATLK